MSTEDGQNEIDVSRMVDLYHLGDPDEPENSIVDSPTYVDIPEDKHRYTGKQFIASGGMKKVSKVFDVKSNRHLAMAELLDDAPDAWNEPFVREARLTAMLVHPNIIAVHDLDINEEGAPYFTMELKVGDSLEDILKFRSAHNPEYLSDFSPETTLDIFIKICDAIAFAHSNNVLHLDLKPDQVQVGHFGEVQVCDWGLAKIIDDRGLEETVEYEERLFNPDLLNNMTKTGRVNGTPGYMAPEQITLDREKSKATDVFSLGAILYSILTDSRPYDGDVNEVMAATEKGLLESPRERFPDKYIPLGLNSVVMKAMALRPEDRYHSVIQLREEVNQYLKGHSTDAEKAGFYREFQLFYRRNRAVCRTAISAVLIITIVVAAFFWTVDQQRRNEIILREKAEQIAQALTVSEQSERETNVRLSRALSEEIAAKNRAHNLEEKSHRSVFSLIRHRYFFSDPVEIANEVIDKLDESIKATPNDAQLKSTEVYTYFIMQRFDKVVELADWASEEDHDLVSHSRSYEGKINPDTKTLPSSELASLLRDVSMGKDGRQVLVEKIVAYDAAKRNGISSPEVIEALVEAWNPKWDGKQTKRIFRYNSTTQHLRIGGGNLQTLRSEGSWASGKSLLRFLSIRRLLFLETDFANLADVKDLPLRYISIANTLISDPAPLHEFPRLEWLDLHRGQFSKKELAELPKSIVVVYPEDEKE